MTFDGLKHGKKTGIARSINRGRTQDGKWHAAMLLNFQFGGEFAFTVMGDRIRLGFLNGRMGGSSGAEGGQAGDVDQPLEVGGVVINGAEEVFRSQVIGLVELRYVQSPGAAGAVNDVRNAGQGLEQGRGIVNGTGTDLKVSQVRLNEMSIA